MERIDILPLSDGVKRKLYNSGIKTVWGLSQVDPVRLAKILHGDELRETKQVINLWGLWDKKRSQDDPRNWYGNKLDCILIDPKCSKCQSPWGHPCGWNRTENQRRMKLLEEKGLEDRPPTKYGPRKGLVMRRRDRR